MARRARDRLGEWVVALQHALEREADLRTKSWWERYLRGAIGFRGVRMERVRATIHGFVARERISAANARELALELLRAPLAEDKLAGILLLAEVALPAGAVRCPEDLERLAVLFDEGYVADWTTCDWLCVKVLGPLAAREGEGCARAIAAWRDAEALWRRRAAGVAFVNLARRGDASFPGFTEMLLEVCDATLREERFAQTGTAWVLKELSVAAPEAVATFVEERLGRFTREALRSALEKLPAGRDRLLRAHAAATRRRRRRRS